MYPLGRIGTTEDIANAALWLATDESFLSGQVLQVNGGLTPRRNPRPGDQRLDEGGGNLADPVEELQIHLAIDTVDDRRHRGADETASTGAAEMPPHP